MLFTVATSSGPDTASYPCGNYYALASSIKSAATKSSGRRPPKVLIGCY